MDKISAALFKYFVVFLLLFFNVLVKCNWVETPPWMDELFGDGDFNEHSSQLTQKHLSSIWSHWLQWLLPWSSLVERDEGSYLPKCSTEDLMILFDAERKLLQLLTDPGGHQADADIQNVVENYLRNVDYDVHDVDVSAEAYVSHPINAFHLMKRAANWMTKIKNVIFKKVDSSHHGEVIQLLSEFVLPEKKDFEFGASYGLVTYQVYHIADVKLIAKGILRDNQTGVEFRSNSGLTSDELVTVASVAKAVYMLNSFVTWCDAAMVAAKEEGKSKNFISKIKKMISQGQKDHDNVIMKHGFYHMMIPNDPETVVMTNPETYDKTLMSRDQCCKTIVAVTDIFVALKEFWKSVQERQEKEARHSGFDNLIRNPPRKGLFGEPGVNTYSMSSYLYPQTQRLCRGDSIRPAELDKDLFCFFVDHSDPFLRLGPFKYEHKNRNPEIGLFHDLASRNELEEMKGRARGHMRSTPYVVSRQKESDYSKLRTSKVLYMNEHREEVARKLSDKVELALRFNIYKEYMDSENYQVMNYGIGGTISGHVDSPGIRKGSSESMGGTRITTFMFYLSDVQLGGKTIFPQAGIGIQPEAGSALYWFNHNAVGGYDSRIFHLGCPVGFGNKWIANKWVKWTGQMWNYPCAVDTTHFSIHLNKI